MVERDWLASLHPLSMLEHLAGAASDRKLRLFACACCRRIWDLLHHEACRKAVDIAEKFAEGKAERDAMAIASALAYTDDVDFACIAAFHASSTDYAPYELARFACENAAAAAEVARLEIVDLSDDQSPEAYADAFAAEPAAQADLLRDIFNPFHKSIIDPAWLSWKNGHVLRLAEEIYDERAFERLSMLADALRTAGCRDEFLLSHGHANGEHVRGCWMVDEVLGKT